MAVELDEATNEMTTNFVICTAGGEQSEDGREQKEAVVLRGRWPPSPGVGLAQGRAPSTTRSWKMDFL